MRIDVVTLFADFFVDPLRTGLVGRAIDEHIAEVGFVDPRAFTEDVHRTVDDAPYGGGAGMVMKPEPLAAAIRAAQTRASGATTILMTPQGRRLSQNDLSRWSARDHLVLVCGRYEGFDERVRGLVDEEISLGDFVMTGGECAAVAIIDGVVRLLPGTLGNDASPKSDSFATGLLEHPHYTRPPLFEGSEVPEVLRSGDHAKVEEWRHRESLKRTLARRSDLFVERGATEDERSILVTLERPSPRVTLVVGWRRTPDPETLSDLARLAAAYRVEVRLIGDCEAALARAPALELPRALPLAEQKKLAKKRRSIPTSTIDPKTICRPFEESEPLGVKVSLTRRLTAPVIGPRAVRALDSKIALLVGPTGLTPAFQLPSLRVASDAQDLPLLAAAAVALDRLLGEGD